MKKNFCGKLFLRGIFASMMLSLCISTYAQKPEKVNLPAGGPETQENRLIKLRDAMESAKTVGQRAYILDEVGKTGTFLGMVYANNYINDKDLAKVAANAVADIALKHPEYAGFNTCSMLRSCYNLVSGKQRKAIDNYLEQHKSCPGFVSAFNGKDLTGWQGLVENPITRAKMSPAELAQKQVRADEVMHRDWGVVDGKICFTGKGFDNLCTVKKYGDFEMYVDWQLDPNGAEPDAGIYLRGTPQVQIWDTSRVNVGAQVGSGGLYNNQKNRSTPTKVADNKLGMWNSFYIKMVDDKVTVKLNGVTVVDNVVLENYWDRNRAIFPVEQIELQAHGSLIYYRDIYIKGVPVD